MAILFELSEGIIKQAALIAAKYPDRTMLSVIEECFNYGAKSLYTDAPKPVPPPKRLIQECFTTPVHEDTLYGIQNTIDDVVGQAKQEAEEIEGICYDDVPDDYGIPSINSNGEFEL
jgi:hypothetical protein